MKLTRTATLKLIRYVIVGIVAILIIAYIIWRSFDYARGPKIEVLEPTNGSGFASSTIIVRGKVERTSNLFLNGKEILVDEKGNFSEPLIIFKGQNILVLSADDQFGRHIETKLELVGLSDLPSQKVSLPLPSSTSTATTTI